MAGGASIVQALRLHSIWSHSRSANLQRFFIPTGRKRGHPCRLYSIHLCWFVQRSLTLVSAPGDGRPCMQWVRAGGAVLAVRKSGGEPFPPHRMIGNIYYVGSRGLAAYLITTPQGHILINSNLKTSVPLLRESIEKLGFRFSDVKILPDQSCASLTTMAAAPRSRS